MIVEDNRTKQIMKFAELRIGDCFQYVDDTDLYMKISTNAERNVFCFASNTIITFNHDDAVIGVKAKVVVYD